MRLSSRLGQFFFGTERNIDIATSGSQWTVFGSPSLAHLLKRCAQDVPHPTQFNRTLWDALYDSGPYPGAQDAEFAEMWAQKTKVPLGKDGTTANVLPLGSGSDYTVFLQRLGVRPSPRLCLVELTSLNRLLALIKAFLVLRWMLGITTIPSTTPKCGRRRMVTRGFIAM